MYNVMSVSFGCLVFALLARAAQAATVEYFLTVTLDFQAPDCVTKLLYAVNGQYPGPALNATQGDTVVVHVTNNLYDQNTAIHFHGLHKKAAPFYDGAYGASDCGIRPGETFTYTFSTGNQVGTFWYHSHLGLQRSNGLYGLFIIYPKASVNEPAYLGYDAEMEPMLLNDWWHENIITQQLGLFRQLPKPFIFVGNPLSLLINGVGTFNCSDTAHLAGLACNATNPDCGIPVFDVVYGMTYRLRIVGVTSLSYMTLNIQAHNLTLVEADGFYTEPLEVENLDVNGAQSFSVLLKADQPVGNYWIQAYTRFRAPPNPPSVLALLRYSGASSDSSTFPAVPPQQLAWNATGYYAQQRAIVPRAGFEETVPAADRAILLVAGQGRVDGAIKWSMNNYSFVEPSTPYLLSKYYGLYTENDTGAYDEPAVTWNYTKFLPDAGIPVATGSKSLIYDLAVNETVQIVVQNSYALNNRSEQHPWHLHGHDFWVLGWGDGIYDPATDDATFNLVNPVKRNTVTLYPAGWVAIRFTADNPGFWPFHCHITFHLVLGMQVAFFVGKDSLPLLPTDYPVCGAITPSIVRSVNPSAYPSPPPTTGGHRPPGHGKHPPGSGKHPPGRGHHH